MEYRKTMSDDVVKISMNTEFQKAICDAVTPKEQRYFVSCYIKTNLIGKYMTGDGRIVVINGTTADKFTHLAPEIKLRVVPRLRRLIRTGQLINIVDTPGHKKFCKMAYYRVKFSIYGVVYVGDLNIGIMPNGTSTLYDLNPFNLK